jgi:hypothetical protein
MWAERSTFRMPTNQISETSAGRSGVAPDSYFKAAPETKATLITRPNHGGTALASSRLSATPPFGPYTAR